MAILDDDDLTDLRGCTAPDDVEAILFFESHCPYHDPPPKPKRKSPTKKPKLGDTPKKS